MSFEVTDWRSIRYDHGRRATCL